MVNLTKVYVGVDVSKDTLDIFIRPINKTLQVQNSQAAVQELIKLLKAYNVQVITCESSGGYENLMLRMVAKQGYHIQHVDPRRIKGFAASEGIKTKTDAVDAKVIALFAEQKYDSTKPANRVIVSERHRKLQELNKRKRLLTKNSAMEKNRLQHPECSHSKESIQEHLEFLAKAIEKLELEIKKLIKNDAELEKKAKLLLSIPGVGEGTTAELLASLPELGSLNNKQITALAGLAPYSRESGTWQGKSFIRDGRSGPRTMLYMAAFVGIRCNEKIKGFYDRLIAAGKSRKVALIASMRKLLEIMNTMIRKGEAWNPQIS